MTEADRAGALADALHGADEAFLAWLDEDTRGDSTEVTLWDMKRAAFLAGAEWGASRRSVGKQAR